MAKITFLNRYFWPDDSATAQLLADLAADQAKRGHEVTVLTSRQLYRDATANLSATERWNGVQIRRIWTTAFGRDRLVGRAIDYLTFYLSTFFALLRLPPGTQLVTLTDPPLATLVSWLPARLRRLPQVHWSQDVFPEILGALKVPPAPVRWAIALLRILRNRSLRSQMRIAAISDDMKAHFVAQGLDPSSVSVLPNWSSGDTVYPVEPEHNPLRREWGLNDTFVVGYSGNLGRVHDYETFLGAAHILRQDPRIRFLFIGSGALHRKLQASLPAELRDVTVFKPYQDREKLSQSLSVPDLHWISLQPGCTPFVFPSKFYGVLAAGRPSLFVGDTAGELPTLLKKHDIGLAVRQGDATGFAEAVRLLVAQPDRARAMGHRAAERFRSEYEATHALQRWDAFLHAHPAGRR